VGTWQRDQEATVAVAIALVKAGVVVALTWNCIVLCAAVKANE